MLVTLKHVDNPNTVGQRYVGDTGYFRYDGDIFTFSSMYSSLVQSIVRTNDTLVVTTRNSIYTFEDTKD